MPAGVDSFNNMKIQRALGLPAPWLSLWIDQRHGDTERARLAGDLKFGQRHCALGLPATWLPLSPRAAVGLLTGMTIRDALGLPALLTVCSLAVASQKKHIPAHIRTM